MSPGLISLSNVTSFPAHKIFTSSMSEPHASSLFTIICKLPCELHPGFIKKAQEGGWKRGWLNFEIHPLLVSHANPQILPRVWLLGH